MANTLLWKPQENTALIIKVLFAKVFFLPNKITVCLGCYALYFALTDSTAASAYSQIVGGYVWSDLNGYSSQIQYLRDDNYLLVSKRGVINTIWVQTKS